MTQMPTPAPEPTTIDDAMPSWETIGRLIDLEAPERLRAYIDLLPAGDVTYSISRLDEDHRIRLFSLLSQSDAEYAASLMEHFEDEAAADIIEELPPEAAAAIVEEMDSDDRTDVLYELDEAEAEAILGRMDPEEAEEAREHLQYEPDTAGGLMISEVLMYRQTQDVDQVIADLRSRAEDFDENDYESRYVYVVDENERLRTQRPTCRGAGRWSQVV